MKITICGSIAFIDEMLEVKAELEDLGHEVRMPPTHLPDENGNDISVKEYYTIRKSSSVNDDWVWELKTKAMKDHFNKVAWSDAVLILNYAKNGIDHYIGANTFLEMGLALHLNKPVYLLNPIPELDFKEEIFGMHPVVLHGDLSNIPHHSFCNE